MTCYYKAYGRRKLNSLLEIPSKFHFLTNYNVQYLMLPMVSRFFSKMVFKETDHIKEITNTNSVFLITNSSSKHRNYSSNNIM